MIRNEISNIVNVQKYSNNDFICIMALSVESNIKPNIIIVKKERHLAHAIEESKDGFGLGPSWM